MKDNQELDILPILWHKRKVIVLSMAAAMVLMSFASLLMPDYYKGAVLFYPVSESLQQPIVNVADPQLTLFGNDKDVDRLLSIANSAALKQELIEALDLYNHYKLNKQNRKDRIKIYKKLDVYYDVEKTSFDAIRVSYEDLSPEKAAEFANVALQKIDEKAVMLASESRNRLTNSLASEIAKKQQQLDVITQSLREIKEQYGIYDLQSQAEAFATLESRAPNDPKLKERIKEYTTGVSQARQLEIQQEALSKIIIAEQNELDKLRANQDSEINALHVVEYASVPDEKSRPKRALYVIAAGIVWLIIVCTAMLTLHSVQNRDWI